MDRAFQRTKVLTGHLLQSPPTSSFQTPSLSSNACLNYSPPELSEKYAFDISDMRKLMDGHDLEERDRLFGMITQSKVFNPRVRGGKVFVSPDYNQSMEQQREMTWKRIEYLFERGVFQGWLTGEGEEVEMRRFACFEVLGLFDHSISIKLGVHFFLWFDNVRVPRENLLNSVADVSPDGKYLSAIKDPDQRFAAFLAPLTAGRVNIAVNAVYQSKVGLAIAIRYALTRRAFSLKPKEPEVLLLDYPSHQRRLLPLLAKTYAMSFGANYLKMLYVKRTPQSNKIIHVVSSSFKATFTWSNMQILQECREACGGQGLKTENRVGHLKAEHDVQSTFEGDNNILMQQVSKALFAEYMAAQKPNKAFKGLGLEHMNKPCPVIPSQLTTTTLRCSQFQMDVLCLRERDLLNRFVAEVSQCQAKGESKEHAFIMSYQLAEDLGKAFSDRAILQTFVEAEATLAACSLKDVLGMLRSLYALNCLEDGAYLRYGYLSVENAATVRREITKICSELRPHALALVSSFGIPDAFLSPIAFNWIDANSWSSAQH
uniref:acyl-CoA oxidase n=1 Tax=Gossypium raimondii TaxID=29730 RepID=A0A0D2U3V1_GOSRA|nr:hypothetical protein B456_008G155500 [Gossypium raimondii]